MYGDWKLLNLVEIQNTCGEVRNTSLNRQVGAWAWRVYGYHAIIPSIGKSGDLCEYENIRIWGALLLR